MTTSKHIRHYHRHFSISYPVSTQQKLYSIFLMPAIILLLVFIALKLFSVFPIHVVSVLSVSNLVNALGATFLRLLIAYVLALLFSIPLAMLINYNVTTERLLLPLFDILQSIPALAFFPMIIVFFIDINFLNGAAIFILFLSMTWNIVFSIVGGLKVVPTDIKSAAQVFKIRGFAYFSQVLLPAVVPYIITGSLLAWAQGWNVIIVAEVLHTYIPGASSGQDLFGIGSVLVNSIATGQNGVFLAAIILMTLAIAFLNFFVWQKLLKYAERYKFE